jgi:hypothetical protein
MLAGDVAGIVSFFFGKGLRISSPRLERRTAEGGRPHSTPSR